MGREAVERSGQGRLSGSPPFAAAAAGMTFRSPRLLDQCHEAMRVRHLARNTERVYVYWVRRFILHHGKRHPLEMELFRKHLPIQQLEIFL